MPLGFSLRRSLLSICILNTMESVFSSTYAVDSFYLVFAYLSWLLWKTFAWVMPQSLVIYWPLCYVLEQESCIRILSNLKKRGNLALHPFHVLLGNCQEISIFSSAWCSHSRRATFSIHIWTCSRSISPPPSIWGFCGKIRWVTWSSSCPVRPNMSCEYVVHSSLVHWPNTFSFN